MILLLLMFFHFIIYWMLILSSPPCTKRILWPVKHQRQVWPVCCNKSGARSRWRRVRKHTKVILELHLWYMVYSKDFWPHSTGICFQSLQQWQQQKGHREEENVNCCRSHLTRMHRLYILPWWRSAYLYQVFVLFHMLFLLHYGKILLGLNSTFCYKFHWNYIKSYNWAL